MDDFLRFHGPTEALVAVDLEKVKERNRKLEDKKEDLLKMDITKLTGEQLEARLATVLERGSASVSLEVDAPSGVYVQWVPNNPQDINRAKMLGFEFSSDIKAKYEMHKTAEGHLQSGDVVAMALPVHIKEALDRVYAKKYKEKHDRKRPSEYRQALSEKPTPTIMDESVSDIVEFNEISSVVKRYNENLQSAPGEE